MGNILELQNEAEDTQDFIKSVTEDIMNETCLQHRFHKRIGGLFKYQ